ncbi:MAG: type III-B CRISPR-associated protein Cas10/Cmr2 [Chlorobium sp.]|uniref:type III-B CRISPR-associated protein Cas10/Cmr2 n=1 Tax=Chlorobium sp. TaxID=1095 RepID=UPI0025BCBF71|nr:type III-B CRISPR-associated protein Cas10/Cmr2 [Chlorobium sp.]MCF8382796.1 type III-B CRISPR-associated protein Cas10/Cmr2 [Chlorobium sp.]
MSAQQYLFLFTIGPVQSFIAQARKTRDLYAGSAILGDIIDEAVEKAGKKNIIIPNPDLQAKPNRFLAKIISDDPQKFANEVEEAARTKWRAIALRSFTSAGVCQAPETNGFDEVQKHRIDCTKLGQIKPTETKTQIEDFLEIYWVMLKLDHEDDYQEKYDEIQKLLGAVKNTRNFKQINELAARKCALDGERNALFYRSTAKNVKPTFIQDGAQVITKEEHFLNPGEGLSAVSLVKRFYKTEKSFPSTAKISLSQPLAIIEQYPVDQKVLDAFKCIFDKKAFDEQLFYEDNLTENYFIKHGYDLFILEKAKVEHEKVKAIFKKHNQKFQKYYALITFDGDDMGKVWSGEFLMDKAHLEIFQKSLAKRLGVFANKAEEIVNTSKGITVYAGGDDFLGFVNLNALFKVMSELREEYDKIVSAPIEEKYGESKLTFSAGVAIAHYKEPLGVVLKCARQAEREAKEIDENKAAFSLMVLKGSGQKVSIRYKWYQSGVGGQIIDKMNAVVKRLLDEDDGYSNTFIKNIDRSFRPLLDSYGIYYAKEAMGIELRRLLANSSRKKEREARKTDVEIFFQDINRLYRNAAKMDNFFSCLHICDFIKRELKDVQSN